MKLEGLKVNTATISREFGLTDLKNPSTKMLEGFLLSYTLRLLERMTEAEVDPRVVVHDLFLYPSKP